MYGGHWQRNYVFGVPNAKGVIPSCPRRCGPGRNYRSAANDSLYVVKKENIRLNDLAEKLNLSNSNVSGTVDRLVSAGLVARETSKQDRRAVVLSLTDRGRQAIQEAFNHESVLRKRLKRIEETFKEEEILQYLSIQQKMKDILLGEE